MRKAILVHVDAELWARVKAESRQLGLVLGDVVGQALSGWLDLRRPAGDVEVASVGSVSSVPGGFVQPLERAGDHATGQGRLSAPETSIQKMGPEESAADPFQMF